MTTTHAMHRGLCLDILTGTAIEPFLDDLARLRIAVFAEWPYLYAGNDPVYERAYLDIYRNNPSATLILVRDGDTVVGASTALPLGCEVAPMRDPIAQTGLDIAQFHYFGESVVLPAYRGRGLGRAFFEHREDAARSHGAEHAIFCAVRRAPDHPQRPPHARDLAHFWTTLGYTRLIGPECTYAWCETGSTIETNHTLDYWAKPLGDAVLPACAP